MAKSIFDRARQLATQLKSNVTDNKGVYQQGRFTPLKAIPQYNRANNYIKQNVAKPLVNTMARAYQPLTNYVSPKGIQQERARIKTDPGLGTRKLVSAAKATPMAAVKTFGLARGGISAPIVAGAFGGAFNKATGGSFTQGLRQGIEASPTLSAVGAGTNPLVNKLATKLSPNLANSISKFLAKRAATGVANVPEGMVMNRALGNKTYTPQDLAIDFTTGALGGPDKPKTKVKGAFNYKPGREDVGVLDQSVDILRNKKATPQERKGAERALYYLAERYLKKDELPEGGNLNVIARKLQKKWANLDSESSDYPFAMGLTSEQEAAKAKLPGVMYSTSKTKAEGKQTGNFTPLKEVMQSTDDYVRDLVGRQKQAKGKDAPTGIVNKGRSLLSEIKEKFVDTASPIEDAINTAEKKGKFKVLPSQDPRLQIDRVLRSRTLASQFAEDNGMVDVIRNTPDLDYLDQYMIAKQARDVEAQGIKTGRNRPQDDQLINELGPQYEEAAQKVNEYSRKLLNYSVETGLIDKNLAQELIQKYPNYVPINRVFSEMEKGTLPKTGTKAIASLSKQSVVQKLKGSEREITSPIESLLLKTQDAFNQGEKNKAARMLAQMKDIPFFKDLIRELPEGQDAAHKFHYLDNGKKRTFETTRDIESAAKNLTQEQMGFIGKLFSVPTRVLQLGATGLNLPFVITNVVKDQMTTFINSNKAANTSLLNPVNFTRAFFSAIGHDDLYKEVVREGAGGTSFDIARQAPDLSVKRIRAGRSTGSKIKYAVTHPDELIKALEDIVGRGEEITRIQNYRGTKNALLKEGRTAQDATLLGAKAARENTANFARKGSIGKVVNNIIPFFNAGIQGARQLDRSFQTNPKGTVAKMTIGLFMPVAAATTWNLSDPDRRAVYDDIDDFEKENNIILIPDGATQDEQGRWNVIKIPIPPGLSNLTTLVRRPMEQANGLDPVRFSEIATNLFTASTSMDVTNTNKMIGTVTPQAIKPLIETYTNTNLFTGNKVVPDSMKYLPPELQSRDTTAPGAKKIGNALGVSPLKVENFVQTAAGGVGTQLIGKEDPGSNLQRRFSKASGGKQVDKQFEEVDKLRQENATNKNQKEATFERIFTLPPEERKQYILENVNNGSFKEEDIDAMIEYKQKANMNLQPIDKAVKSLPIKQRATYITNQLRGKTPEEKKKLVLDLVEKKILTEQTLDEIIVQMQSSN